MARLTSAQIAALREILSAEHGRLAGSPRFSLTNEGLNAILAGDIWRPKHSIESEVA